MSALFSKMLNSVFPKGIFLFAIACMIFIHTGNADDDQGKMPFGIYSMENFTPVRATQKWFAGVQSVRFFRDSGTGCIAPSEFYLVATTITGEPFIFDRIEYGCGASFKTFDINGDGKSELLVFYQCGDCYMMDVYSISENYTASKSFKKWENVQVSSDFHGEIEVDFGVVRASEKDGEKKVVCVYSVKGNTITSVRAEPFTEKK